MFSEECDLYMRRSISCNVIAREAAAAIFGLLAPLRMRSTVNLAPDRSVFHCTMDGWMDISLIKE